MLLLSLAGSVVFYALYGLAVTLPPTRGVEAIGLMMLARIGAGIAGASVGTAAAVIADCTTPQNRSRGMALIGIAFGAGFTLGPLIAYFGMKLFNDKPWAVGALASALSAVALLFAFFVFRETRDPANRAGKEFFSVSRSARVLAIPAVGALVLIYFLSIFSFANFEATLARLTEEAFGMTDDEDAKARHKPPTYAHDKPPPQRSGSDPEWIDVRRPTHEREDAKEGHHRHRVGEHPGRVEREQHRPTKRPQNPSQRGERLVDPQHLSLSGRIGAA
jgi:hypothetical protein